MTLPWHWGLGKPDGRRPCSLPPFPILPCPSRTFPRHARASGNPLPVTFGKLPSYDSESRRLAPDARGGLYGEQFNNPGKRDGWRCAATP